MRIEVRLPGEPFQPEHELASFSADGAGAVVSFTGLARPETGDGAKVERLHLDHHPRLTEKSLHDIAASAERFGVAAVRIVHRRGAIAPGEAIVFVAAAARHRRAAFDAVDCLMDRLKTDAVFWKREDGVDAARWIEPTEADRADRARWSDNCPD
ncbi:MAG TPA: molybdenum cofactor biosynthesis protein MoaE [Allosphingosinicella sp.]|nr:molybdenum cofactor biosynthesis protein MoaE [Allosphingosinicella sp.]